MQPFSRYRDCPKCGASGVAATWHSSCEQFLPEHIHRRCERCGFDWPESPVDKSTNPKP
jgi:hypothetical protein